MSKLLIETNLFQKILDTFFKAKAAGKENEFLSKLKKHDDEIGQAFDDLDTQIRQNSINLSKRLKSKGIDTTELDSFINNKN
jgi:hypothetical protein